MGFNLTFNGLIILNEALSYKRDRISDVEGRGFDRK